MNIIGNKVNIEQKVVWLLIALVLVSGFVVQDAKGQTSSNGLVAYYNFDGDVSNKSGNGNDGTNNGATFVNGKSRSFEF